MASRVEFVRWSARCHVQHSPTVKRPHPQLTRRCCWPQVFQAGTTADADGQLVAAGGRLLGMILSVQCSCSNYVYDTDQVFHAGTTADANGQLVAAGGRVLGITALGQDIAEAQQRAYQVLLSQLRPLAPKSKFGYHIC